jgi:hypothetical protein
MTSVFSNTLSPDGAGFSAPSTPQAQATDTALVATLKRKIAALEAQAKPAVSPSAIKRNPKIPRAGAKPNAPSSDRSELAAKVDLGSRAFTMKIEENVNTFTLGDEVHQCAAIEAIIGKRCKAVALSSKSWPWALTMCNQASHDDHKLSTSVAHSFTPAMLAKLSKYKQDFRIA